MPHPDRNHIHTFRRSPLDKTKMICQDPRCTTYQHPIILLRGKAALCNKCGNQFTLTDEDLRRAKPICIMCSNTKKGEAARAAKDLTNKLFSVEDIIEKVGASLVLNKPDPSLLLSDDEPDEPKTLLEIMKGDKD